jgi:SAM-dependent methyltransferase
MERDEFLDIPYSSPVKITRETIKRALAEAASKYARGKLVDIGCGTKPYEPLFRPFVETYFGVDFEGPAESNYGSATRADLYADCTATGLEAGSFDTLVSTQVMEHILDTAKYLAECHRLLRPGSFGIFTVPFAWQCHAEPYDFYRFTRYALDELFRRHGFEMVELRNLEGGYATLLQTRIVSQFLHTEKMAPWARKWRGLQRRVLVPWLNWKGLHLDRAFWNEKLCLNYFVVVRKVGPT